MSAPIRAPGEAAISSLSLEEARDRYLDFLLTVKGCSPARAALAKGYLNRLLGFLSARGVTSLPTVTRAHLEAYQEAVLATARAVATKREILGVVGLCFRYLCDYGLLTANPALVLDRPRKGQTLPRPLLTAEEFTGLLGLTHPTSLVGLRDRCLFQVLYASAMRPEELCRLTVGDVDLATRQLLIRRPKNRRDRIVHIDRYTARDLQQYQQRLEAWLGRRRAAAEHCFLSATGGPLIRNALSSHFLQDYAPRFQARWHKAITLYSLRHSSATDWLDAAAVHRRDVLPYVQRQLGHESLESTAIYTHVAIEPLRQIFREYHPRERAFAALAKIPSFPEGLQARWKAQRTPPPPEAPLS